MAAAEDVRDRLRRATTALDTHGVPYAVIGECATAEWVGRVDAAAMRTTQHVDILLNRDDLGTANIVLKSAGIDMILDGVGRKSRDAVRIAVAGEQVHPEHLLPAPGLNESASGLLSLEALVRMKLTSFRRGDRVDLRDLIDVELIDTTWPAKFPPELAARLQELLDTPDG